jgi:hypothetical protein
MSLTDTDSIVKKNNISTDKIDTPNSIENNFILFHHQRISHLTVFTSNPQPDTLRAVTLSVLNVELYR